MQARMDRYEQMQRCERQEGLVLPVDSLERPTCKYTHTHTHTFHGKARKAGVPHITIFEISLHLDTHMSVLKKQCKGHLFHFFPRRIKSMLKTENGTETETSLTRRQRTGSTKHSEDSRCCTFSTHIPRLPVFVSHLDPWQQNPGVRLPKTVLRAQR